MSPLVSILVPVYNAERFLESFIQCLVRQRCSSVEYVFVDDCSTDESGRLLEGLSDLLETPGSSVRIIHLEKNGGVSEARQTALTAATGEYVIFADPDDVVEPGMYEGLLKCAKDSDADFVWEDFYENGVRRNCCVEGDITGERLIEAILLGRLHGATWNKLIRRSFIESCGAHFLRGRVCLCEDVDFLCQVLSMSPHCAYLSACHYRYQIVSSSATHRLSEASFRSLKIIENHLKQFLLDEVSRVALETWIGGNRLACFFQSQISDEFFYGFVDNHSALPGTHARFLTRLLYKLGTKGRFRRWILAVLEGLDRL